MHRDTGLRVWSRTSPCYGPPPSFGISVQIFGRCTWGSLRYRGSVFIALPRMAFCVRCTCFIFAIFKPQKYALMRKRGPWRYLGGRKGMQIISQSCGPGPLCRAVAQEKKRGVRSARVAGHIEDPLAHPYCCPSGNDFRATLVLY